MLTQGERELLETNKALCTRVLEQLSGLPAGLRQTLADHLWASINETVFESGFSASAQTVTAVPQTSGIRRITGIYTLAPTGQGATIQLGNSIFLPVPAGFFYFGPISVILQDGERGVLTSGVFGGTQANAGPIFLGMFGQQLPRYGDLN